MDTHGLAQSELEDFFHQDSLQGQEISSTLQRCKRIPMNRNTLPPIPAGAASISTSIPNMTFGYELRAFSKTEAKHLRQSAPPANSSQLVYPFFALDFIGDSEHTSGSIWVAINQALGSSAACLHTADQLNQKIRECKTKEITPINNCAFSLVMRGSDARLYISWKPDELSYCTRQIKVFHLLDPDQLLHFRKRVRNILEWDRSTRLKEIQNAINELLKHSAVATDG